MTEELTNKERDTLRTLKGLASEGAKATDWQQAAADLGVARGTFYSVRRRLLERGLISRSEGGLYSPAQRALPVITAEDVISQITREGTRSNRAYVYYIDARGDRRMHYLVTVVLDEAGLAKGQSPWSRKIDGDTYEQGYDATVRALAELEKRGGDEG